MKIKKFLLLTSAVISALLISGCGKQEDKSAIKYVTSCYPVHIIAMNLVEGIDNVELVKMSENHSGCLHDFRLQSSDLKNIENSSAFIINGAEMENFVEKVKEENPNINLIDSSYGISLIGEDCGHDHEECDEDVNHHHCAVNSHIWLSPENYMLQIKNIAEGLKAIDPEHAEKYQENAENYTNNIRDLKIKMHQELDEFSGKDLVTFHNAFPYFAKEFRFNILGVMNHEPGEEPSAKEILDIINLVKNSGITAIFTEPQYPDNVAKTISKETGAEIYTLNPAVTGDNKKDAYIEIMEKNLEILKIAFER